MTSRAFVGIATALTLFSGCSRRPTSVDEPPVAVARGASIRDIVKGRKIYPYSVIPGGVGSVDDIQDAVQRDPVVAGHYSLLKVSTLQKVQLSRPIAAYVSFRIGTRVFWTARKLNVAAGETVFLDKEGNGVRGRCGNQLSRLPMTPVTEIVKLEPTPYTLDTPVTPGIPPSPQQVPPVPAAEVPNLLSPQPAPPTPTPSPIGSLSSPPLYQPIYGFPGGPLPTTPPIGVVTPPGGVLQPPETPVIPVLPVQFGPTPTVPTYSILIPPFGYQPLIPGTPAIPVLYPPTPPGTPELPPPPVIAPPGTPPIPTTPPVTPPTTPPDVPPTTPPTTPPDVPPTTPPEVATPEPLSWLLLAGGLGLIGFWRRKSASS